MSRRGERGQATAELALVLPFVFLLALLVVQVGVLAHRQVLVTHAAREAARAAAVADDAADIQAAAEAGAAGSGGLDPSRTRVVAHLDNGLVQVEVSYLDATDVALIGPLLPDVTLRARTTMRWEAQE